LKNIFKNISDAVITRLKGKEYVSDPSISNKELFLILYHRFFQALRGMILKITIKSRGLIFCGRRTNIHFRHKIRCGKSLVIEEGVSINALSKDGILLGDHVTIGRYSNIIGSGVIRNLGMGLKVGDNSNIGSYSHIGFQGEIEIGNYVIMGPYVKIFSENHNFEDPSIAFKYQGETRQKVTIADNCWIGSGSIILAGVSLGSGVVVAAGSVVTKSFGNNLIIGGVPAKILRKIEK
jgi:acetyltransferase-like isoleucine patch superfamily enzyme